jgi:hypothetical protein
LQNLEENQACRTHLPDRKQFTVIPGLSKPLFRLDTPSFNEKVTRKRTLHNQEALRPALDQTERTDTYSILLNIDSVKQEWLPLKQLLHLLLVCVALRANIIISAKHSMSPTDQRTFALDFISKKFLWRPHSVFSPLSAHLPARSPVSPSRLGCVLCQSPTLRYP